MITSTLDGVPQFVIATPTKCGTTTLEEMCRRHGGGRVSRGGVEVPSFAIYTGERPRRQHRMALPSGGAFDDVPRFLMIRNPYLRYMSMYEYLRAPHNYSKFGAREIQGKEWGGWHRGRTGLRTEPMRFDQFLYFVAEQRELYGRGRWVRRRGELTAPFAYRSPWVWLDSLTDSWSMLAAQPGDGEVEPIRLESFWSDMAAVKERFGLRTLSVRPTIQANRTLTYRRVHGNNAVNALWYWGEIKCAARVFRSRRGDPVGMYGVEFAGPREIGEDDCECAACAVGVAREAIACGYSA